MHHDEKGRVSPAKSKIAKAMRPPEKKPMAKLMPAPKKGKK